MIWNLITNKKATEKLEKLKCDLTVCKHCNFNFKPDDRIYELKCDHIFHAECQEKYDAENPWPEGEENKSCRCLTCKLDDEERERQQAIWEKENAEMAADDEMAAMAETPMMEAMMEATMD
jgi:hypothetical protein